MANMAYVRFENTLEDLRDCYNHMDDNDLSESEQKARAKLIRLCEQIAHDYGDDDDDDD